MGETVLQARLASGPAHHLSLPCQHWDGVSGLMATVLSAVLHPVVCVGVCVCVCGGSGYCVGG